VTASLTIRPLELSDAAELSSMLTSQPPEYMRYFVPFAFDQATLSHLLRERVHDVYLGIYWEGKVVALCMLRGWDDGYEVPAYGVVVAERYRRKGLGALTLEVAKTLCRLRDARQLMLKVHPDNVTARGLYERAGFRQIGVDPLNSNLIMQCDL